MEVQLLKIMYAPNDYIKREYLSNVPAAVLTQSNTILNQRIIEQHDLLRNIDFSFKPGPFITAVINGWAHIPRVATLLGCYLLRIPLTFSGAINTLDATCRSFMALPLGATLPPQPLTTFTTEVIQFTGANALVATLENSSPALSQRAKLIFSTSAFSTEAAKKSGIIAPSILIMAFNYAKIN